MDGCGAEAQSPANQLSSGSAAGREERWGQGGRQLLLRWVKEGWLPERHQCQELEIMAVPTSEEEEVAARECDARTAGRGNGMEW